MQYRYITSKQLPSEMIPVWMLYAAFDRCTPYDCPSREWLRKCYSWAPDATEVSMDHVARVMRYCLRDSEYVDRFVFYFAGECVGPYDVLKDFFAQAFDKT